jgi:hypothetical protein
MDKKIREYLHDNFFLLYEYFPIQKIFLTTISWTYRENEEINSIKLSINSKVRLLWRKNVFCRLGNILMYSIKWVKIKECKELLCRRYFRLAMSTPYGQTLSVNIF